MLLRFYPSFSPSRGGEKWENSCCRLAPSRGLMKDLLAVYPFTSPPAPPVEGGKTWAQQNLRGRHGSTAVA